MAENPNQPREYDAVLGGQAPAPDKNVVLGGLEDLKRCLASPVVEQRIAALCEALNYGQEGLDLVIQSRNESRQVEQAAYQLLIQHRANPRVQQALEDDNSHQLSELLRTLLRRSSGVNMVAFSPDG